MNKVFEFSDLKAPTPDDSRKAPTMKVDYRNLSAVKIETGTRYRRPTQDFESAINRDSPALLVMTDLCKVAAVTVEPNVSIDVALEKMKSSGVRSLLVIDTQQEIVGLITATDIQGEKPLQFTQDNGVSHADILVRDIMTKRDDMDAMPIESVQDARVGDIVETLKRAGRQHALVAPKYYKFPWNKNLAQQIERAAEEAAKRGKRGPIILGSPFQQPSWEDERSPFIHPLPQPRQRNKPPSPFEILNLDRMS